MLTATSAICASCGSAYRLPPSAEPASFKCKRCGVNLKARQTTGSSAKSHDPAVDAVRQRTRRTQVTMGMKTRKRLTASQVVTGLLSLAVIAAIALMALA